MKLYYAPGACSIGIHVLLEEIGKPYDREKVDLAGRKQFDPAYTAINPKSKIPTLVRDDGSALTEYPAIATWLAMTNPDKKLMPTDAEGMARVLETMDYIVATLHMHGFSRLFATHKYALRPEDTDSVKAAGREMVEKGFALLDARLAGKEYVAGTFSVADSALFYVEFWAGRVGIPLPPNCAAHFARMKARPSVQRVFAAEGLPA